MKTTSEDAASVSLLPVGSSPAPVPFPHFPDRLHAFVWRNWSIVSLERMAKVVGAKEHDLLRIGMAMGLPDPPRISSDLRRRIALTVIRRNWHLLPYEQILELLGWTEEELAFSLREDDFLYIKLGSLKPKCEPLRFTRLDDATLIREKVIRESIHEIFPRGFDGKGEPLFGFLPQLTKAESRPHETDRASERSPLSPRFCYSYFAPYGDPLLDDGVDPYPDGYLARLAESGVDGVWLHSTLYRIATFPWDSAMSDRYEERLKNLRKLIERAKRHGIGVYLYMNEPRAMPLAFFETHPDLKGVVEGDHATLCTSRPEVRKYLADAVESVCRAVPDLAGFFTITMSENLTHCWSHGGGGACPRCGSRGLAEVVAEANRLVAEGIRRSGSATRLISWDWGWPEDGSDAIIDKLPEDAALMSVSEWDLPIVRGGVESRVGEYSLSSVGPGPRALNHWKRAKRRGLKILAKIQANNSWELSSVPYVPATENVAKQAENLLKAGVEGVMLGWTLGGHPSPNLEVVSGIRAGENADDAMRRVAVRRFGAELAPAILDAWRDFSAAYREYPFHIEVAYCGPQQLGPANPLWEKPTGYRATMVGFPYDDFRTWRAIYPEDIFIQQMGRVADGFDRALSRLRAATDAEEHHERSSERLALADEMRMAEAVSIHLRSVANQSRFCQARDRLLATEEKETTRNLLDELEASLNGEIALARRLYELQREDSRLGFEASNQYYYVPLDLAEKALNCHDLLHRWLPAERKRRAGE